jgi:hypothetical protein
MVGIVVASLALHPLSRQSSLVDSKVHESTNKQLGEGFEQLFGQF